ncbi:hypothetical protein MTBBW1_310003 [Desulfamplus magnetovallimortis]|uniref:Uncharacterized protein n=1 Tax=Desulfamplus magnetovallimortis TaxID=1246637 RepID=A0A1W1HFW4_9BACT|nr:hypothetical protein MTBBW1_310003 [Desulfamplus magnetovallimortis]
MRNYWGTYLTIKTYLRQIYNRLIINCCLPQNKIGEGIIAMDFIS